MALVVYKSGAQIIKKYEDVNADFPIDGLPVADTITIGIDNQSGSDMTVEYTLDSESDIEGGSATWINSVTVSNGNNAFIVTEYGPTGVLITASAGGGVAWIKS